MKRFMNCLVSRYGTTRWRAFFSILDIANTRRYCPNGRTQLLQCAPPRAATSKPNPHTLYSSRSRACNTRGTQSLQVAPNHVNPPVASNRYFLALGTHCDPLSPDGWERHTISWDGLLPPARSNTNTFRHVGRCAVTHFYLCSATKQTQAKMTHRPHCEWRPLEQTHFHCRS